MRATLQDIKAQLRERRHDAIPAQGRWLKAVVTGYFAYHAVPTNFRALGAFHHHVTDLWRRSLRRRSQRDGMTWNRMSKIAADWLPRPRILHGFRQLLKLFQGQPPVTRRLVASSVHHVEVGRGIRLDVPREPDFTETLHGRHVEYQCLLRLLGRRHVDATLDPCAVLPDLLTCIFQRQLRVAPKHLLFGARPFSR